MKSNNLSTFVYSCRRVFKMTLSTRCAMFVSSTQHRLEFTTDAIVQSYFYIFFSYGANSESELR